MLLKGEITSGGGSGKQSDFDGHSGAVNVGDMLYVYMTGLAFVLS